MKLPNYKIITPFSVLDICGQDNEEEKRNELFLLQNDILESYGIDNCKYYNVHFFDSSFFYEEIEEMLPDDAIASLAIKDGCDLVIFENRRVGFVAYYNGQKNGFEFLFDDIKM